MDSKTSPTNSAKKLKQSRLPFQIISVTRKDEVTEVRKRRLSESNDDPARATKVGKIDETKENVKSDKLVETTMIVLDDDDGLAPVPTSVASKESEPQNTTITSPDTGHLSKSCDISKKIQKSVKKRKLKVVDGESAPVNSGVLKIKLPVSAKKRNKSNKHDTSTVGSAETAEKSSEAGGSSSIDCVVSKKNYINVEQTPPGDETEDNTLIEANAENLQNDATVPEKPILESLQASSPGKHDTIDNGKLPDSAEKSKTFVHKKPETCKTPVSAGKAKPDTPKQLQRKKEQEQRNLERQRAKEERERKVQEEKVQRLEKEMQKKREREEKEEQKRKEREEREEQKRKEKKDREEKEEQKRLEREEKERKRLAEVEQKNEERKQKEEEKRKKELEAEMKKKRASEAFTKFFVAKKSDQRTTFEEDSSSGDVNTTEGQLAFMPFQKKDNMRIAPSVRRCLSDKSKFELEVAMSAGDTRKNGLYVQLVRNGLIQTGKSERTWQNDDDDVVIVINEMETSNVVESSFKASKKSYRAKFLKFEENQRPAYYGTWRKNSNSITGRKPFAMDDKLFDYEVDSDDEWEEEEPGESLHGSDDEKESEDDYEVDNEFMVPHGHLSEDEEMDDEDERVEDHTPETQKAKLKILQQEFAAEMKKKTEKIKPRLIGCVWVNSINCDSQAQCPDSCAPIIWEILQIRAMVFSSPVQFVTDKSEALTEEQAPVAKSIQKNNELNNEQTKDLIRLVHGSRSSRKFLANEFNAYCKQNNNNFEGFSKLQAKIKRLATWQQCPEEGVMHNKLCWYVPIEIREKHDLQDLSLPNKWTFVLEPNLQKSKTSKCLNLESNKNGVDADQAGLQCVNKAVPEEPNKPDIKKFAKVLTVEERQKQFKKNLSDTHTPKTAEGNLSVVANIDLTEDEGETTAKEKSVANLSPMVWFPSARTTPKPGVNKKRVPLLMSVPRGQAIPETAKNSLISNFLKLGTAHVTNVSQAPIPSDTASSMNVDDDNQH